MKIFTSAQMRELDQYTIEHEPIRSIDLMERAAKALTHAIMEEWSNSTPVVVFAGPGNNGGDALAVARLLHGEGYQVKVILFNITDKLSEDCALNKDRLLDLRHFKDFTEVKVSFDPPALTAETLVIDGLFGIGQNKPLAGGFASLVKYINQSPSKVVSIDIPSGLLAEDNSRNVAANIIKADLTLTLHQKKLSFLFCESQQFLGRVKVLDIRLSREFICKTGAQYTILEENDIRAKLIPRNDFAHKGTMGQALIIAGSYGMAGAAVLAIVMSFVGKVSALLQSIPSPVLGGISIALFGVIASSGLKILIEAQTNFDNKKNLLIASVILVSGIGGLTLQLSGLQISGVALSTILGIVLYLVLPEPKD